MDPLVRMTGYHVHDLRGVLANTHRSIRSFSDVLSNGARSSGFMSYCSLVHDSVILHEDFGDHKTQDIKMNIHEVKRAY